MILILGGTTEGRMAVSTLEEAGQPYFYSTFSDLQQVAMPHGQRIQGGLDEEAMQNFCQRHQIRLLIDAGHPFATQLHHTVAAVARRMHLPAIRLERIYPPRSEQVHWCADYADAVRQILKGGVRRLLVLTGVKTIASLLPLREGGVDCRFRILRRDSSVEAALALGVKESELLFYEADEPVPLLSGYEAILTKESGLSGGFPEKVSEALGRGLKVFAVCRPSLPDGFVVVNGPYGLRRMVERLLPEFFPLHSGLTTGTCATACALSALTGQSEVQVTLPNGESIPLRVEQGEGYTYIFKDSGDDPDVTRGTEIRVSLEEREAFDAALLKEATADPDFTPELPVLIRGDEGVGRITLPGFGYPVGSPAINRVPRQMIRQNLRPHLRRPVIVTISIPEGRELARRTFNPRLGIEGGISVIGQSGIIMPFSKEGFLESVRKCVQVAAATGLSHVVINSGAKSERFIRERYAELPGQVFVEYGNYIGDTLRIAHEEGIRRVTLGVMIGKAVKLAEGHLDTHSRNVVMNRDFVAQLASEAGCPEELVAQVRNLNMARDLWTLLPEPLVPGFAATLLRHCQSVCAPLLPDGHLEILLISEEGRIFGMEN
ncbi:MAG: cobalamin biosynthesis protein CbiD [Bacteroidaceae bacterium]|nr:cobalamin biosynthesis protein CbiD [Bacteroidaceae bacterium]